MYIASYDDKEIYRLGLTLNDIYFLEWFINFKDSNKMLKLKDNLNKDTEHDYYWITYSKVIKDLPLLYIKNNTSINNMLNRLSGKDKNNQNEYPLIRQKINIGLINKTYIAIRPEVIAKMKGVECSANLSEEWNTTKKETKKAIETLLPNVKMILTQLSKLQLPDNRKLFSFTLPTDNKIYTKSMKRFQDTLIDLYEGRFLSNNKIEDWFKNKNSYYINEKTILTVNNCKHNWNNIMNCILLAANNYISWFEKGRETIDKSWLTRDIASFMNNPINGTSMFFITINYKATKSREVVAENMYNKLPNYVTNIMRKFYNEKWDGLAYWNRVYSIYKWYKENSNRLIAENINYSYWFTSVNDFFTSYRNFIAEKLNPIYLKNIGVNNPTWDWFISERKKVHGIDE